MKAITSPKIIEGLRPVAKRFIQEALDDAEQQAAGGQTIDYLTLVARRIPSRMILHLFGLTDEYLAPLRDWSDTINTALGSFAPSLEVFDQAEKTLLDLRELFLPEIEKRRKNPTEDFISLLATAHDEGNKLTEEEMLATLYLTILAGNDSIGSTMALGTVALAEHPRVCAYMRENRANALNAIMELQRYVAMSSAQQRVVSEDFTWHGHQLKKDQFVILAVAGANRDPHVFPDPLKFDPERKQDGNMTFAPGMHFCIGHLLAKMQLVEFFPALVDRFDIEVVDQRLDFLPNFTVRSLNSLFVRLHTRH